MEKVDQEPPHNGVSLDWGISLLVVGDFESVLFSRSLAFLSITPPPTTQSGAEGRFARSAARLERQVIVSASCIT